MKDSFTLDDFILFSRRVGTDNGGDMVDERKHTAVTDAKVGPDKRIIDNILGYSRALTVLKTKGAGNINLLLN